MTRMPENEFTSFEDVFRDTDWEREHLLQEEFRRTFFESNQARQLGTISDEEFLNRMSSGESTSSFFRVRDNITYAWHSHYVERTKDKRIELHPDIYSECNITIIVGLNENRLLDVDEISVIYFPEYPEDIEDLKGDSAYEEREITDNEIASWGDFATKKELGRYCLTDFLRANAEDNQFEEK